MQPTRPLRLKSCRSASGCASSPWTCPLVHQHHPADPRGEVPEDDQGIGRVQGQDAKGHAALNHVQNYEEWLSSALDAAQDRCGGFLEAHGELH